MSTKQYFLSIINKIIFTRVQHIINHIPKPDLFICNVVNMFHSVNNFLLFLHICCPIFLFWSVYYCYTRIPQGMAGSFWNFWFNCVHEFTFFMFKSGGNFVLHSHIVSYALDIMDAPYMKPCDRNSDVATQRLRMWRTITNHKSNILISGCIFYNAHSFFFELRSS